MCYQCLFLFLFFHRTLPEGYYYSGPIKSEKDKIKINALWKFGGNDRSLGFIKENTENMHSCGVKDKNDNLVAFELQTSFGSLGVLVVDPEHRGKRLGKYVMAKLAKTVQDDGQPVYCHIEKENKLSLKLHKDFGYRIAEGGEVIWVNSVPISD